MKVWIDQEMCTGDGLCEEMCPQMFILADDGLGYVRQDGQVLNDPGGSAQMAEVPADLEEDVVDAERECPGECIHIEAA
jgi:ferredoxin